MKTLAWTVLGMGLMIAFIEGLHIHMHSTYCKTEAEWVKTLPREIQQQL